MKQKLRKSTVFKWTYVMIALTIIVPISVAPAMYFFGNYGLVIPLIIFVPAIFSALKIEKIKKEHNLKTYRQITDFIEGKPISEMKPNKKDKLLTISLVFASALIGFVLVYLGMSVLGI